MKRIKTLSALLAVTALLSAPILVRAADEKKPCCEPTVEAGKKCEHGCCVKAANEGKVCEKCHPKKEGN
ncbi:MAG TPA: hypothetical protein VI454_08355 [Verrucomicrobiae bacterium]|jgi:hypothetical protein